MRVPEYQQSVQQQGLPNARLTTHYTADDFLGGTQKAAMQVGTDLAKSLAHDATNLAVDHYKDQLDQNNKTRILASATDMGTHIDTAMYGANGALTKQGADAFLGSDGKSAMDTVYDDAVKKQAAIADNLSTDSQKAGFMQQSTAMLNAMRGTLMSHEAQEHRVYAQGSLEASTAYHVNNMNYNNNNDDGLAKSIAQIKANSLQLATLNGKPPLWGEVNAQTHISGALNKITSDMIDNGNHAGASNILQHFSQDMNQNDLAGNYSKMQKAQGDATALYTASSTIERMKSQLMPGDGDRAIAILKGSESPTGQYPKGVKYYGLRPDGTPKGQGYLGELKRPDGGVMTEYSIGVTINGKDMDIPTVVPTLNKDEINQLLNLKDGEQPSDAIAQKAVDHAKIRLAAGKNVFNDTPEPVTSKAGAVGVMQVTKDTGPDAAKLAGLPWDENKWRYDPAYNEAIGTAYFQWLSQENHGDLSKAYGAYNAGPNRLAAAVKKGGENWLALLPTETQDYVTKNMAAYNAGAGKPKAPTKEDAVYAAMNALPQGSSTEVIKATMQNTEHLFDLHTQATKQHEDSIIDQVTTALSQNGGDMNAIAQSLRDQVPGDKRVTINNFAKQISDQTYSNNPEAWAAFLSLPAQAIKNMTPTSFSAHYRTQLDSDHLEKGMAIIKAQQDKNPEQAHLEVFSTTDRIKRAAQAATILPNTGKPDSAQADRFAKFETSIDQQVRDFESRTPGNRKASSEELQKIIDTTLLNTAMVYHYWPVSDTNKAILAMSDSERSDAYVMVNDNKIELSSIPDAQRTLITNELQSRNLPVTEQAIAQLWVSANKPN